MQVIVDENTGKVFTQGKQYLGKISRFTAESFQANPFASKTVILSKNINLPMYFSGFSNGSLIKLCSNTFCNEKYCYMYKKGCCRYNPTLEKVGWDIPNVQLD
ncbi:MAG: hypothetical protein E7313_02075 [Clostridiales bacterium]|nr:hypothetical protein [Clostridiales bacterium]